MDIPFDPANIVATVASLMVMAKYLDRRLSKVEASQTKLSLHAERRAERLENLIKTVDEIKKVTTKCPLAHAAAGVNDEKAVA